MASPERRRSRMLSISALLLVYASGFAAWFVFSQSEDLDLSYRAKVVAAAVIIVTGLGLFTAATMYISSARSRYEERLAKAEAEEALDRLTSAMELKDLLLVNRKQMQAYDALARGQAASSYRIAQIAIAVGLIVLVGGSIIAIAAQDETTKITTAALTAIGGAIAGYIGRTFLVTYQRALDQLNFYFEQPLITSYILTVERIAGDISPERQDEIKDKVISRIMDALVRPYGSPSTPEVEADS
jgi:hypothetical protein